MHTISSLRKALGLSTANQVRNRLDAVRDVLEPHLRRGPNNQILVADEGLALLRQLQELIDSGLRLTEASDVLRATSVPISSIRATVSSGSASTGAQRSEGDRELAVALRSEIAFLRARVVELESRPVSSETGSGAAPWWTSLREDLDVA